MSVPGSIWEGRITKSYHFTLQIENNTYILRRIGTHDFLRKPRIKRYQNQFGFACRRHPDWENWFV
ncbi:MAG: hypothetical protein DRP89_02750 [Candidatus Neomarinimicrobiota bacterium]|nr:MAG: hypothetical protein DRP89_02750 [Candidatus Neomarinimicrobiota bacterium]